MTAKQWLLATVVVILAIIAIGALLGTPNMGRSALPTSTRTPPPSFTPPPQPTATAILMPTLPPDPTATLTLAPTPALSPTPTLPPTPIVHIVAQTETLETIAAAYGIRVSTLRELNQLPDDAEVQAGQELILPSPE